MCTRQPLGVASMICFFPSSVSAQLFACAARSTARSRSDTLLEVHAVDLFVLQELGVHDIELPRGARELHLEHAILGVVEDALPKHADAARAEYLDEIRI